MSARFIGANKRTPQVQDGDSEGGCVQRGQELYGNSVFSAQFYCELKPTLKKFIILKKGYALKMLICIAKLTSNKLYQFILPLTSYGSVSLPTFTPTPCTLNFAVYMNHSNM